MTARHRILARMANRGKGDALTCYFEAPRLDEPDALAFVAPQWSARFDLVGTDYVDQGRDRRPSRKGGFGPSVGTFSDPLRRSVHAYECQPERSFLTVLMAQWWVESIREQVKVQYDWKGTRRTHTFDVLVTEVGGHRVAFAVKSTWSDVARGDTEAVLEAIAEQVGDALADDFRIVTREGLDPVEVLNASLVVGRARDQDRESTAAVLATLRRLGPTVTLRQVRDEAGLGSRGTRAAVALVMTGAIAIPVGEPLSLDLALSNRVPEAG